MILKRKLNLFEKNIKYKFKDLNFLKQSLTHPSFYIDSKSLEKKYNNFEKLEFLGDRVLGLVVASLLFNKNINKEGDLSKKYSYLVQKNFLYKISQQLSIQKFLLYDFNKNKKMLISILSDSVESLRAIFIDGGYRALLILSYIT